MKRFTESILALSVVSALLAVSGAGCTTGQPRAARIHSSFERPDESGRVIYMEPVQSTARTVISKNYAVGTRRITTVGEPMVGVRDYTSSDVVIAAVATRDFVQHCRRVSQLDAEELVEMNAALELAVEADVERATISAAATAQQDASAAAATASSAEAAAADSSDGLLAPFRNLFTGAEPEPAAARPAAPAASAAKSASKADPIVVMPDASAGASAPQVDVTVDTVEIAEIPVPVDPVDPRICASGRLSWVRGEVGERFGVAGVFVEDGKEFYLLDVPTPEGNLYVAVDKLGKLKDEPYLAWRDLDEVATTRFGVPLRYVTTKVPLDEETRLFRFETTETMSLQGGDYRNFELVFEGTSYDHRGMVYHVLYKEYGRDRPTTPIFVQDLAYARQMSTVDILGMRIRVHDVSDDEIVYTVQRD